MYKTRELMVAALFASSLVSMSQAAENADAVFGFAEDVVGKAEDQINKIDDGKRDGQDYGEPGRSSHLTIFGNAQFFQNNLSDFEFHNQQSYFGMAWEVEKNFAHSNVNYAIYAAHEKLRGSKAQSKIGAAYRYALDLGRSTYGYGDVSADTVSLGSAGVNGALMAGLGYYIFQGEERAWRMEIGTGVAYDISSAKRLFSQQALELASRYYQKLGENTAISNDTRWTQNRSEDSFENDFGLNFEISENTTLRLGVLSDWNSQREAQPWSHQAMIAARYSY